MMLCWLLLGCPAPSIHSDTGCEAPATWYADADGDGHGTLAETVAACDAPEGYVASSDDCDDTDETVFPGATEICDGADEDCDGTADDGLSSYADADGDGYGDASVVVACADGVVDGTDCDDGDGAVNPNAVEICDGVDNDCDGVIDLDAMEPPSWYADADGDGWGAGAVAAAQCEPVSGHASESGDCDDADAAVSPGAEEICDNGVDEDCDGGGCRIEDDWDAEEHAAFTILGETAYEYILRAGPLSTGSGPGMFVANHNHVWLFRTAPTGEQYVSASDADIHLDAAGEFWEWSSLGDVDGDGVSELALTAGYEDPPTMYLVPADAETGGVADRAELTLVETKSLGMSPAAHARDADGDGAVDFAVGARGTTAWILPLATSGAPSDLAVSTCSSATGQAFGAAVDLGDVDGDGLADLVVGASGYDTGGSYPDGAAYLFLGPHSVAKTDAEADFQLLASMSGWFGMDVRIEQDLDGDGIDDLLAGGDSGSWALYGAPPATGSMRPRAYVGTASMPRGWIDSGDIDGDGAADLASGSVEAHIFYGPVADGSHTVGDATIRSSYSAGSAPWLVGDLDQDGFDDLGIGASARDTDLAIEAGTVWGLMGSSGF